MSNYLDKFVLTKHPYSVGNAVPEPRQRCLLVKALLAQDDTNFQFPFVVRACYDNRGWREYQAIFGKTKKDLFPNSPDLQKNALQNSYKSDVLPYIDIDIADVHADIQYNDAYCDSRRQLTDLQNFVEFMVSGGHRAELQVTRVYCRSQNSGIARVPYFAR